MNKTEKPSYWLTMMMTGVISGGFIGFYIGFLGACVTIGYRFSMNLLAWNL